MPDFFVRAILTIERNALLMDLYKIQALALSHAAHFGLVSPLSECPRLDFVLEQLAYSIIPHFSFKKTPSVIDCGMFYAHTYGGFRYHREMAICMCTLPETIDKFRLFEYVVSAKRKPHYGLKK